MIIRLYGLVLLLSIPFLLLRLLWRSGKQPEYRHYWHERLGLRKLKAADIWIHAVSVGEVNLATHLIDNWWADTTKMPRLVISCTTPAGRERIKSWLVHSTETRIQYCYLPFDMPAIIGRLLETVNPAMLLIMETEVWPGLIMRAQRYGIKTVLVNARMSANSARGYSRIQFLVRPVFASFDLVLAQSRADARRLQKIGVRRDICHIAGSMKFDFAVSIDSGKLNAIKTDLGHRNFIWTIGSSRLGEEQILLEAIDVILSNIPKALVCWAPRHDQLSAPIIEQALYAKGYRLDKRSSDKACKETQVLLIDRFGEMAIFYSLADCVFIGGTLVPTGSQNLIEPALLAKPIISGPSNYNFALAHRALAKVGALMSVSDAQTLIATLLRLADDSNMCVRLGELAREAMLYHQGATQKQISYLSKLQSTKDNK